MTRVSLACIVEGHGEVPALPKLVRRIFKAFIPGYYADITTPIRIHRSKLTQERELARALEFAVEKAGAVLILVDADDACPVKLAATLRSMAAKARPDLPTAVVIATREYEAWFIAAAHSLDLLPGNEAPPENPEAIRGAKEWVNQRFSQGKYSEVADQPSLSERMSLEEARRAPSFDKLVRDLTALAYRADS